MFCGILSDFQLFKGTSSGTLESNSIPTQNLGGFRRVVSRLDDVFFIEKFGVFECI